MIKLFYLSDNAPSAVKSFGIAAASSLLEFISNPILRGQCMPEQRGKQATADVKSEWTQAYQIYLRAPGDRYDKKKDRTSRIDQVAVEMKLTRKQAKRRIRNYEAWQRNIKKGLVEP